MADVTYECRNSIFKDSQSYTLTDEALVSPGGTLPLAEITRVRVFSVPGMRSLAYGTVFQGALCCAIRRRHGRKLLISNLHYLGPGRYENRSDAYRRFVRALVGRLAERYPATPLLAGMPPLAWWFWFLSFVGIGLIPVIFLIGAIAVIAESGFSRGMLGFLAATACLFVAPASFLPAVWRRRSRPLDPREI